MKRKIRLIAAANWSGYMNVVVVTEDEKIFILNHAGFTKLEWQELPKIPDTD